MSSKILKSYIGSVATAVPPYTIRQPEAKEFIQTNYEDQLSPRNRVIMRKVFDHPSIFQRNITFDDPRVLVSEDADDRIARFQRWSVELSTEAVKKAMDRAGVTREDITGIVVNTCTGYLCPGISTYLIEKLDLPKTTRAYDLVGAGCGGALPNMEMAQSILNANPKDVVLSVSVEICTATYQMGDDLSLIISNAIFGDGAAAAVIWRRDKGIELVDSNRLYVPAQREAVRYIYKNGNLRNKLSSRLPEMLKDAVGTVITELLARHSLKISDIGRWAIHPGGDRIIVAIKETLTLTEDQLRPTREVLHDYGNMSSPTIWFVIDKILNNGVKKDDWIMGLAFGAGLSVHAFLLRKK